MISIQYGASVAKGLFPIIGTSSATTIRISIAALLLVLIFKPWTMKLSRRDKFFLVGYGASLGFMNLTFYEALNYAPLGIVVALEFIGPLAVSFLYSKKLSDIIWAIIAALGIYFIYPHGDNSLAQPRGVFFGLVAAFFWGSYILFGKKIGQSHEAGKVTALGMVVAAVVTLPFGLKGSEIIFEDRNVFVLGFLVAIFSSALPYTLEMHSLKKIPAKTFGILMSLEPVVAMLIGFIFLSEKLEWMQYSGIGCIILASLGATFTNLNKSAPALSVD